MSRVLACHSAILRWVKQAAQIVEALSLENANTAWVLVIKNHLKLTINGITEVNDRVMTANITIQGYAIKLIVVYAPTNTPKDNMKTRIYRGLAKNCATERHQKRIAAGDLNASTQLRDKHNSFQTEN